MDSQQLQTRFQQNVFWTFNIGLDKQKFSAKIVNILNKKVKAAYSVTMNIFQKKNIFFLNHLQK